ncbi:MAG: aldehyde dehydrogenase family protein [Ardenticatenales bacterium]|nr:aldehyde dehydrogenase family protein [Ardenticatenales bacterium]
MSLTASLTALNPATGRVIATYPAATASDVRGAVDSAHAAYLAWRDVPLAERCRVLDRVADVLRGRIDALSGLMADEMGKPVREGRAEVEKCATGCAYFAARAAEFLAPELVATDFAASYVCYRPLGVLLAIMPWNFPLWQVVRFAAPALAAGNAVILKHAPNVPGCALALVDVFAAAGLPVGVFQAPLIDIDADPGIVPDLIVDPRIAGVTLTGSTRAGRAVAAVAGAHLKKTVLELGGSDAYVVLADADIDAAAAACVTGRMINGGQSCIAAKRFIVEAPVRDAFERRVVDGLAAVVMGDPHDEATTLGPMARRDLRDALHRQVVGSVAAGARLIVGGEVPSGPGAFYPPTLLGDVRPGMPAFDEELFGPVAVIVEAADEEEAIALANASAYGLGAAVFTRDAARGEAIVRDRLESGAGFVNAFVRSDPRMPFGGVRESGYGRELGRWGIREWVNVKTVVRA